MMQPVKEITVETLQNDGDWQEVFGEDSSGNTSQEVDSLDGTSTDQCLRSDVAEIIAAVNGENDESDWIGVFRLKDGRFLAAWGWCDYTGWDCQADNMLTVASSLGALIESGVTPESCDRLGLAHPDRQ